MSRHGHDPDRRPVLAIPPQPLSAGEDVPPPATARDRAIRDAALARIAEAADRVGVDRRRFLHTASGVAGLLATINLAACSTDGDGGRAAPGPQRPTSPSTAGRPSTTSRSTSTSTGDPGNRNSTSTSTTEAPTASSTPSTPSSQVTTTGPGGVFEVPEPEDVEACAAALTFGGAFILDVHTHHVIPDGPWVRNDSRHANSLRRLAPNGCGEGEPLECLDRLAYLEDMFLSSETTVAILSNVPAASPEIDPLTFAEALRTRELVDALSAGGEPRVLVQHIVAPNFGLLGVHLDAMTANVETGRVVGFKTYTGYGPGGRGYALDGPDVGLPFLEHARSLGVKVISVHKGLPLFNFDLANNGPRDLAAVAGLYPDLSFVVYHSAWQRDVSEGPYDAGRAAVGVSSLVKALQDHAIAPNTNVYAELGTTWRELVRRPTEAAHVIGKLMAHVGEDNVLWGTDAIWLGSPQPQIMAFKAFQITPEFQDRFDYPELTEGRKRKILGDNAARLYGLDSGALRCVLPGDALQRARDEHAGLLTMGPIRDSWLPRGPVTRRDVLTWLARLPGLPAPA